MKQSNFTLLGFAAWAGLIAPVLFVGTFLLDASHRPGYNQLSSYVSALSLGPMGWIQIVNFVVFGALLFFFTRGGMAVFFRRKASKAGVIMLIIIASGYFFSGPCWFQESRPVRIGRPLVWVDAAVSDRAVYGVDLRICPCVEETDQPCLRLSA